MPQQDHVVVGLTPMQEELQEESAQKELGLLRVERAQINGVRDRLGAGVDARRRVSWLDEAVDCGLTPPKTEMLGKERF